MSRAFNQSTRAMIFLDGVSVLLKGKRAFCSYLKFWAMNLVREEYCNMSNKVHGNSSWSWPWMRCEVEARFALFWSKFGLQSFIWDLGTSLARDLSPLHASSWKTHHQHSIWRNRLLVASSIESKYVTVSYCLFLAKWDFFSHTSCLWGFQAKNYCELSLSCMKVSKAPYSYLGISFTWRSHLLDSYRCPATSLTLKTASSGY